MDEKQTKKEQTIDNNIIEHFVMSILDDGKQLSIRIPSKVREALQINPEKDVFLFTMNKETLDLQGFLLDRKDYEKEGI